MVTGTTTPVGVLGGERDGQTELGIGFAQPDRATIRGQGIEVEGRGQLTWCGSESDGR